jgi:hypothetical protein
MKSTLYGQAIKSTINYLSGVVAQRDLECKTIMILA